MSDLSLASQVSRDSALRSSQELLQVALAAADLGAWVWHIAEDRTEADARALALFGFLPDAELTLAEALPDDAPLYAPAVAAAADPKGAGTLRVEFRIPRPDSAQRWMEVNAMTVFEGTPPLTGSHDRRIGGRDRS